MSMLDTLCALLLPDAAAVALDTVTHAADGVTATVRTTAPTAACPRCAQASSTIHACYRRTLADLPWARQRVRLHLWVRRFRCPHEACPQRTFTERLPQIAPPYAHRTPRLATAQRDLALAHGGEAGARTAQKQGMTVSPDTLLRLSRQAPLPPPAAPTAVGIDEWALQKGRRYGAIVVDLETHQVLDLLPDAQAETMATWLAQHPTIRVVSRDRAGAFADAARRGAPQAVQVADRFPLLQNLSTALQDVFAQEHDAIQMALCPPPARPDASATASAAAPPAGDTAAPAPVLTRHAARTQETRARRLARYEEVHRLHAAGYTQRAIAAELGLHRATVAKFIQADTFPERQERPPQPSILDPYKPYLHQRLEADCRNGMDLLREIQAQGYTGSQATLLGYLAQYRREQGLPPRTQSPTTAAPCRRVSVRQMVGLILRRADTLDAEEQQARARLWQASPTVTQASDLAQTFVQLVRQRTGERLDTWLEDATRSEITPLARFATGIRATYAEVRAALDLPWSNGVVEGQINRLKTIRRSMYGRGKLDLLRQRVLAT